MTISASVDQLARQIATDMVSRLVPAPGVPDYDMATNIARRHLSAFFAVPRGLGIPPQEAEANAKAARKAAPRRTGKIRNMTTGVIYPSATEAARALYLSPSTIANHLNNPDRQPTVAGCVLRRVASDAAQAE